MASTFWPDVTTCDVILIYLGQTTKSGQCHLLFLLHCCPGGLFESRGAAYDGTYTVTECLPTCEKRGYEKYRTHTLIPRRPFMRTLAGESSASGESGMAGRILKEMSSLSSITFCSSSGFLTSLPLAFTRLATFRDVTQACKKGCLEWASLPVYVALLPWLSLWPLSWLDRR